MKKNQIYVLEMTSPYDSPQRAFMYTTDKQATVK